MTGCWVPGCSHNNVRDTCSFFRLPKERKLRMKWHKNIGRKASAKQVVYVCSCHFVDGDKKHLPTLRLQTFPPRYCSPESPEKRVKRRRRFPTTTKLSLAAVDANITDCPSTSCASTPPIRASTPPILVRMDEPFTSVATVQLPLCSPAQLEAENYFLKKDIAKLQSKPVKLFHFETLNDNQVLLYTGIPSHKLLDLLFNLVKDVPINYFLNFRVEKVTKKEQMFIALMKLRQNFPYEDLSVQFGVSKATICNIVITWIHVLHEALYKKFMSTIPPPEKNRSCLRNGFSTFTNCRIILDCTEVYIGPCKSPSNQKLTYSSYKHRNTLKGLVGVAPNGVVTYVSNLYPGSTSDRKIVQKSGIITQFQPGDLILADKGFLIRDLLPDNVYLNVPPFLSGPQFTKAQVQQTQRIARARIHVERAIHRMKCFKILQCVPHQLLKHANVIFQTIGALTNLQYPNIQEMEKYYDPE